MAKTSAGKKTASAKGVARKPAAKAKKSTQPRKTTAGQAAAKYEQAGAPWWKRLPLPDVR